MSGRRNAAARLSHAPGHAQVDFGEAFGMIGGIACKLHYFAMSLPHSDAFFMKAYPAETTEAFCDGHNAAFAFFGGVPSSMLYDNTTIAVAKICGDGKRGEDLWRRQARGVGALVAITYKTAVDDPTRFARSKAVGVHFGLTPKRYQSGQTDVIGRITKVGDSMARAMLYEAAQTMLTRSIRFSTLKHWALSVARRRGMKRAKVALARKLAVVLHRMWTDGREFRWGKEPAMAA